MNIFLSSSGGFVLLTVMLLGIAITPGQQRPEEEEGEVAEEEKSCQKWIMDLVSILLDALMPCIGGGGWGLKGFHEISSRLFCLVKCLLTELGLLGEDGKLDGAAAAIFFGDNFPEGLRNEILLKADHCFPFADAFNGSEYYCRSYAGFSQCAGVAVAQAMIPYVVGCFGNPFAAFSLNVIFSMLTSMVPAGRSAEPSADGRMQKMDSLWEPKNQLFLPYKKNNSLFLPMKGGRPKLV